MISTVDPDFEKRGTSANLLVLLHAYTSNPVKLRYVRDAVAEVFSDADILIPKLSASAFSFANPIRVVCEILDKIDACWECQKAQGGESYKSIIIVGHSLGAILGRKVYVYACGEQSKAPFEPDAGNQTGRKWARNIERIVLLAGTNRGWSISHHMSIKHALLWTLGTAVGNFLMLFTGGRPFIFNFRRGAPFLTNLRIQWLAMRQASTETGVGQALTIQLLGSVDDIVGPNDDIDLVSQPITHNSQLIVVYSFLQLRSR